MATMSQFERIILNFGYKNPQDFLLRYFLPLISVVLFFYFIALFILISLPPLVPYGVLVGGFIFIVAYPYMSYEKKRVDIDHHLHLFITYAGTISTIDINRNVLFNKLSERKNLGEISRIAQKIQYFSSKWNLGFSRTCRKIAKIVPSKIFSDFLDRLAVMMDFGENIGTYLNDEQNSVMEDYAANYKKSLENIKTLQEIFMSLTMALGFLISIGLIIPLLSDISMESIVRWTLLILFGMDLCVLVFVHTFIPSDPLMQQSDIVDVGTKKLRKWTLFLFPLSSIITITLFVLDAFPFLVNIAIGISPLFIIGLIAQKIEGDIVTKDAAFPAFIRSLGSAVEVKGGAVMQALQALRVHDFGSMNDLATNLYRRLKTGNDKYISWKFFSAESGSQLINQFSMIFAESVFLGGAPQRIGEIISDNFQKLLSLRKQRIHLASGLRGALYGALVGFSASAYVAAQISSLLNSMFNSPFSALEGGNEFSSFAQGIMPGGGLSVDMNMVFTYIGIMIIVHSVVSAMIIKVVDGGTPYAMFFDIAIMLWIGAALSVALPKAIRFLVPSFNEPLPDVVG